MSIDPALNKLFLASQKAYWFDIVDLRSNKIIAGITGIKSPAWSTVDSEKHKAYVIDSNEGRGYFDGENSFIYELDGESNRKTNDNIILDSLLQKASINQKTGLIYVIGSSISI